MAMEFPFCSIIVVNYNGKKYLDACLRSFEESHYPAERIEILLVDNGSNDGSELEAQARHPGIRLLRNPVNNFAAALNLGVSHARGRYIAFANNDLYADECWLEELVRVLESNPQAGCAGGKILFENGRINSVWHRSLPDFYWEDDGYNEEDRGQYDTEREVPGVCWAAALFRKACLDDVGPIDEDFVMYYEDVDTSQRCLQRGWKILYSPRATARHVFHGSSQGSRLAEYFSDRNRLLYVAKHHPEHLARAVQTSRFLAQHDEDSLYYNLPVVLKKLIELHLPDRVEQILQELCEVLSPIYGNLALDHLLARMEVILSYRKMSIGFYDRALQVIGGGQRYGCAIAAALQDKFDVTLMASRPVTLADLGGWYGLSLAGCRLEQIPISILDQSEVWIDPNVVDPGAPNPFDTVSAASQSLDVLVNVNMVTMLRPLSPFSIFLCHFPEAPRRGDFVVDEYSCLVVNSHYTSQWVRARWGLEPDLLLYPPVDMAAPPTLKENIILSVARFEPGGSKKQHDLIRAFEQLRAVYPDSMRDWRFVLVGGSLPENAYLEKIRRMARESSAPVEIRVNVSSSELESWYAKAKIFWHACGLGETDPHLIEHFGMTTVEAMQNHCVPIVINGGGQREIVEHGESGFRFDTLIDLCLYTRQVIENPDLMECLGKGAYEKAQAFTRDRFEEFVRSFFHALEEEYRTISLPDPREILFNQQRANIYYSPVARRHCRSHQE